ncbi:hypothetical protein [Streptosporangium carneum]|uniref:DUF2092 domain-containing protein n=1 Tax=Streptosporangium carneum TaxID=47481 RepID=A0A9W6IAQ1_9ACTN|nr:hypothetical protein [Streptosporangium carneum]GLK15210.1 hypothetical protein GCM10017600_86230 [Streptosporangium carneum]
MRRWIAATAVTLTVSAGICAPANAQTVSPGPIDALRRQLVEHRGVTMSERMTERGPRDKNDYVYLYRTVVEFGRGEVVATDTTYRPGNRHTGDSGFRYMTFDGLRYMKSESSRLPPGKSWALTRDKEYSPALHTSFDIGDPATLRAVLATTRDRRPAGVYDGTRTTLHQGVITIGDLYKASRGSWEWKPTVKEARVRVSWRIWIGQDQLIRRVWSMRKAPAPFTRKIELLRIVDARLTGWGVETHITPPPADQVVTVKKGSAPDLDAKDPQEVSVPLNLGAR